MKVFYIIYALLYLFQTSQFSTAKCPEMFVASILFVIVYHQGLNHRPVASLGCDWVIGNNNFEQEREISDSLHSCGLFAFKNSIKKGFTVVHLASPQGLYSGFEEPGDVDCSIGKSPGLVNSKPQGPSGFLVFLSSCFSLACQTGSWQVAEQTLPVILSKICVW